MDRNRFAVCVGQQRRNGLSETGDGRDSYKLLMSTNLDSAVHLSQLAHPLLKASGSGNVVFISSITSLVGIDTLAVYAATKGTHSITWFLYELFNMQALIIFFVLFRSNESAHQEPRL